MALVIEGTWEEVKRHEKELTGRRVRVIVDPRLPILHNQPAQAKNGKPVTSVEQLQGRGMFAGVINTEEYLREKRADTAREDRAF